jgi:glycosyltransferase involved in cell wall biosynthesis
MLFASTLCAPLSFSKRVHIAYCAEAARRSHRERGYCDSRAIVLPNGYDSASFIRDEGAGRHLRAYWGIDEDTTVIGMGARYDAIKDHPTFLAAAGIAKRKAPGKVVFFMFGDGITESNGALKQIIRAHGLTSSVILAGHQDNMVAVYSALDFLVLSSRGEAFPSVICEAMLCEVPCIATDVGDCRRIIDDSGYVVPPGTPAALGESICTAVCLPGDVRHALGSRAREIIGSRYSAGTYLSRHLSAYDGLIKNGSLPALWCGDSN